jgi:FtsZ-binding cell division protein ZapB
VNQSAIAKKLELLQINPDEIPDKQIANTIRLLLQIIEELSEENEQLKAEVQTLRDEISHLKGEQGKPIMAGSKKRQNKDMSSEDERKRLNPPKQKRSKAKIPKIKIDCTEVCTVDPDILPDDAEFKGYQNVIVQEISIKTKNTEYRKEVYYSPSQHKTYIAKLPLGVEGEFGSELKSLIYTLKHAANMSESKIHEFLESIGIYISSATISRILTKNIEHFHQEKADIFKAGLTSTLYQQIDDTGAKVHGQNHYVQILCNLYYTAYFTLPNKDRLGILDILQGGKPRQYYFNEEAFALLKTFNLSKKMIAKLRNEAWNEVLDEEEMQQLMGKILPNPNKGKNQLTRIMEAAAIAAYHKQTDFPVIPVLLSDDAPQFKQLTWEQGLCWVHDARNYKKLNPVVPLYKKELEDFQNLYWDFYRELLQYKNDPTPEKSEELWAEFDQIFSTRTNYKALDDRIAKTKAKKSELLKVLKYPELPLHNNDAELGARGQVRKRDVSLHTMTDEGTRANDTFSTIVQTAKKLGVSVYDYIHDRVSKNFNMTSLAELIKVKKSQDKTVTM